MNSTFYALWLPITDFQEFTNSVKNNHNLEVENDSNSNWAWFSFPYEKCQITIDSLGFIYLDGVDASGLELKLELLVDLLNKKSLENIQNTFLNIKIGYENEENSVTKKDMLAFLKSITLSFPPIKEKIKFEHIDSTLHCSNKELFFERNESKFSLYESNEESINFHTILNRNFQNLLQKSIFYTHGLYLEKGELYDLSIVDGIYENIEGNFPELTLKVNKQEATRSDKERIFKEIVHKVIQDTIEEKIVLNFLKVTKIEYLSRTINAISENNEKLKKLNSYLLEDINQNQKEYQSKMQDLDDESATEIFIQNLLQVIPKFYMMDTKIQEAYYIKVGNTTTNLNVKRDETILNTLYYRKWKASINFFIETATKAKESLGMYHQNKTLKELEDISYNANYQADIEDIRELQKNKALSLDEDTKKIFLFLAVVTLAGEAPILELPDDVLFWKILYNFTEVVINFLFYFIVLSTWIIPLIVPKETEPTFKELFKFFKKRFFPTKEVNSRLFHEFEESDYDKHEHRSSRSLYSYKEKEKKYDKIVVEYNNLVSSYTLVERVKKTLMSQHTLKGTFSFELFPKLLQEVPIDKKKEHIYRENYRISGNDRVATKIMYRYKISELKLQSFLDYMEEDSFMVEYENYLKEESKDTFSIEKAIEILRQSDEINKEKSQVTLYIVYSFVLKFYSQDKLNENIYKYTISKDQFRVHYHINMLDYRDESDFQKKQESLAKLVDIYFLKRLKRFKEVELVKTS